MWSALNLPTTDISCPACMSHETNVIKRKYIFTALRFCRQCGLMFRIPKEGQLSAEAFYQESYSHGFTTDCPSDEELLKLKSTGFRGTEKDYTRYIEILQAAGIQSGARILDFGASWGYGSWQFAQAGYSVYTYEISRARARYAAEKLNCNVLLSLKAMPEQIDCFFSAHVVEHLTNPNDLWIHASNVLKPIGKVVILTPNGERIREEQDYRAYHQLWGKIHPLLLTAKALSNQAQSHGFEGRAYSSPFELDAITNFRQGDLTGAELLYVAQRNSSNFSNLQTEV